MVLKPRRLEWSFIYLFVCCKFPGGHVETVALYRNLSSLSLPHWWPSIGHFWNDRRQCLIFIQVAQLLKVSGFPELWQSDPAPWFQFLSTCINHCRRLQVLFGGCSSGSAVHLRCHAPATGLTAEWDVRCTQAALALGIQLSAQKEQISCFLCLVWVMVQQWISWTTCCHC